MALTPSTPAVFLDKDGTLVEDVPYNVDPDKIRLAPGVAEELPVLTEAGYKLIVISNQPGIALGYFDENALALVELRISALLAKHGARIDGYYWCPHYPDGAVADYVAQCDCRKPMPGLILQAASDHGVDLTRSWFVGDILHDVEAGRRAGCRTILIDNGNETEWLMSAERSPHWTVAGMREAVSVIVEADPFYRLARRMAAPQRFKLAGARYGSD
jgi:D-glycero-D-manno-heptose 1,7-bisphosphate phosphatase